MLGGEPAHRAAYRPSTWWTSSGSSRQLRPVSTTGTRGGPGVQSTGSPTGWAYSFTVLTGDTLDREAVGMAPGRWSAKTRPMTTHATDTDTGTDTGTGTDTDLALPLDRAHQHARRWLAG